MPLLKYSNRKRLFDIIFATLFLIPLSVVMIFIALALLTIHGRPILYISPRMNAPNHSFDLLKFRTMRPYDNDGGATGGHKHWRITRFGHFLRRTRLDELPQLFNILRGEMSFVGPRPPLREFVEHFPLQYKKVLTNPPGVTGLATMVYHAHEDRILHRCKTAQETQRVYYSRCLPTKLRLDIIYQVKRNWRIDLWIIANTVMTVIIPKWKRKRLFRPKNIRK